MRPKRFLPLYGLLLAVFIHALSAFAFLPPEDSAGPITVAIAGPREVIVAGKPFQVVVTIKNSGSAVVTGTVRLKVSDDWQVFDGAGEPFSVAENESHSVTLNVAPGKGSYAALYPVHAYARFRVGSADLTAHAILITSVAPGAVVPSSPTPAPKPSLKVSKDAAMVMQLETRTAGLREKALQQAKDALAGKASPWSWRLESEAGATGVSVAPGPCGLADAYIAFVDQAREVVFNGFTIQVDREKIGPMQGDLDGERTESHFAAGLGTITTFVPHADGAVPVRAAIWSEKGALRISFEMPGVKRNPRGEPRFTELAIGPASQPAHRVYAGFGNVIQDPGPFDLRAGGFTLSTRHVGIDFANGLSLVEASDIFPDRFHVDPDARSYALVAHHDVTFSFVPSEHGAFAAARVYQEMAGFEPAGGVAKLLGRVCLDQWGGDYEVAAQDVGHAARYGLTDAVFVKHVWQRWGYDYRLPDIYPPAGDQVAFHTMVEACKQNGILFCPHDNYIDFYPDADGYSYDDILFNEDGTPQRAWFNKGRGARSYRWAPNAFWPRLEANLKQVKDGFAPTAYFVDVFSAMAPMDFYDRAGRFFSKTVTTQKWGAAFDRIREILGNNAPTISEAGQDALIGHLDAGEADHKGWDPNPAAGSREASPWNMKAADGERVPWHDMASHGSFVLLGGGLGHRYAGGQDETLHGYGSDDYLSMTVLGGRNPMCDGPFSRRTVMTYWLLHDVCNGLAHDEMLADEFAGDDIHRQVSRFSNEGVARVNRGKSDWTAEGQVLPQYGFVAKAGDCEAEVTRRAGIISACAKGPGSLFVDARPANQSKDGDGEVLPKVTGVEDLGNRRLRLRIDWQVMRPVRAGFTPFVHFVGTGGGSNDRILFQAGLDLDPARLAQVGTISSTGEVTVPADIAESAIRFGLYNSNPGTDGKRLPMLVSMDDENRAQGGTIRVEGGAIHWQPEPADPTLAARSERLNTGDKVVDFGPAATNGAFRLVYGGATWELVPLPGSGAVKVKLRLDRLNATGRKVLAISGMGEDGKNAGGAVKFRQDGATVEFDAPGGVFEYRITMQE